MNLDDINPLHEIASHFSLPILHFFFNSSNVASCLFSFVLNQINAVSTPLVPYPHPPLLLPHLHPACSPVSSSISQPLPVVLSSPDREHPLAIARKREDATSPKHRILIIYLVTSTYLVFWCLFNWSINETVKHWATIECSENLKSKSNHKHSPSELEIATTSQLPTRLHSSMILHSSLPYRHYTPTYTFDKISIILDSFPLPFHSPLCSIPIVIARSRGGRR